MTFYIIQNLKTASYVLYEVKNGKSLSNRKILDSSGTLQKLTLKYSNNPSFDLEMRPLINIRVKMLKIKQLDVGMSPPAFHFTLILTLTFNPALWPWPLVTFDLDPFDLWPLNHINAPNKIKKSRFSTWRPWPLTYDLDICIWPRYGLGSSPCKIWQTYSKWFWRYEFFSSDFFSSKCENHVF